MRKDLVLRGCLFSAVIAGLVLCSGCIPLPVTTRYTLTLIIKGQGTVVDDSGVDFTGGTFDEGYRFVLNAQASTSWHFDHWEGDAAGVNTRTLLTMDTNKTVIAVFKSDIQYTLTVNTQGQGTVTPSGGSYSVGDQVTLQATPAVGWKFSQWTGNITGTNPTQSLTIDSNKTVTAVFVVDTNTYTLTVNTQGQGTVAPSGGSYSAAQQVTLTATPTSGWHFLVWQGDITGYTATAQIIMTTNKTVTAIFEQDASAYPLTVTTTGQGTVTPNSGSFNAGNQVTLTATPVSGWHFVQWEGSLSGTDNPAKITMTSTKTITAVFQSDIQYTLTTQIQGQGTISLSPNQSTFNAGDVVTLTATPKSAWDFLMWLEGASGSTNPLQITMNKNLTVVAFFSQKSAPQVELVTTMGTVVLELNRTKAPITVDNFIQYVNNGFYDGADGLGATIFHRVIPSFMAQGGGFTVDLTQKTTLGPIQNEASNGLKNLRGTIAMARTSDPNSATSQFFINVVDNPFLDYGSTQSPDGYAVFGTVIQGMSFVDAMVVVPTQTVGSMQNVPVTPIIINSARVLP